MATALVSEQAQKVYEVVDNVFFGAVGDFNNDAKVDLAVADTKL